MILVIGGAGYVGSHVVKELVAQRYRVVVLDNLSSGHRESVDVQAVFEQGDYTNAFDLERVFSRYSIDAVMYFVKEQGSEEHSLVQAAQQLAAVEVLLQTMLVYQVRCFVFSSTTFVQEGTRQMVLHEEVPLFPRTPNSYLNAMIEQLLEKMHSTAGLNYVALRYFNAAGAHESGEIGEDHVPEVHLIPRVLLHVLHGTALKMNAGYETKDGTYIRDYVHVMDAARAHVLALESTLLQEKKQAVYTLGTEQGYSVREIVAAVEELTGKRTSIEFRSLPQQHAPSVLISSRRLQEELGWRAEYGLEDILASAWRWHVKHPQGYRSRLELA